MDKKTRLMKGIFAFSLVFIMILIQNTLKSYVQTNFLLNPRDSFFVGLVCSIAFGLGVTLTLLLVKFTNRT